MRRCDFCWGVKGIPYRVEKFGNHSVFLIGEKSTKEVSIEAIAGGCRIGDTVSILMSGAYVPGVVLERHELWIKRNDGLPPLQIHNGVYVKPWLKLAGPVYHDNHPCITGELMKIVKGVATLKFCGKEYEYPLSEVKPGI